MRLYTMSTMLFIDVMIVSNLFNISGLSFMQIRLFLLFSVRSLSKTLSSKLKGFEPGTNEVPFLSSGFFLVVFASSFNSFISFRLDWLIEFLKRSTYGFSIIWTHLSIMFRKLVWVEGICKRSCLKKIGVRTWLLVTSLFSYSISIWNRVIILIWAFSSSRKWLMIFLIYSRALLKLL